MDAVPTPAWGDIISFLTGTGGVIAGLIYLFRQGQKGEWLYRSVHEFIVAQLNHAQLNQRIAEKDAIIAQQAASILSERKRGDDWQQRYMDSRHVMDQSIYVAANSVGATAAAEGS
jgi:hypothetical protein